MFQSKMNVFLKYLQNPNLKPKKTVNKHEIVPFPEPYKVIPISIIFHHNKPHLRFNKRRGQRLTTFCAVHHKLTQSWF